MSSLRARSLLEIATFTRASAAVYFDSAGVLRSAAVDIPRIEYDPVTLAVRGLLIEGARTNYLLRSQEFGTSWSVARSSVSADAVVAPDGTTTADKLVEDSTAAQTHYLSQTYTKTSSSEVQTYCLSVFARAGERPKIRLQAQGTSGSANSAYAIFDLSAGTASAVTVAGQYDNSLATIQNCGNGWYRCALDFRINNDGQASTAAILYALNAAGSVSYDGDGTSGLYLWGAQLEKGNYATSYIATTTASATRAADVCAITGHADLLDNEEGSLFAEYMVPWEYVASDTSAPRVVQLDDGDENDRVIIYLNSGSRHTGVSVSGATQQSSSRGAHAPVVVQRQAIAWRENDIAATASGSTISADTNALVPAGLANIRIGHSSSGGTSPLNGYIRKLRYYPRRLTNNELTALVA